MTQFRCPICDKPFEIERSEAPPFCSSRCRKIDLGRWMDERYGLPYERPEDSDEKLPPDDQGR